MRYIYIIDPHSTAVSVRQFIVFCRLHTSSLLFIKRQLSISDCFIGIFYSHKSHLVAMCSFIQMIYIYSNPLVTLQAGSLVQWLKLPAWKVRERWFEPHSGIQVLKNKMFFSSSLVKDSISVKSDDRSSDRISDNKPTPLPFYCGQPPWPRDSVLGQGSSEPEFRILCLKGSVISFILPSSGGSPGPVQLICAQRWPIVRFILFRFNDPSSFLFKFTSTWRPTTSS